MIPHTTVAINEAKRRLLDELMGDTQTNPRPIIVTQEDNAESKGQTVAMVLPPGLFEDLSENEPNLYEFQLLRLIQELDTVERHWNDSDTQQTFVERFPRLTLKLWKAAPEQMKRVCLSLDLAAKHLFVEQLTLEQIGALRHFVDLICQDVSGADEIREAKNKLASAGLSPVMVGSQELVNLYVEEL